MSRAVANFDTGRALAFICMGNCMGIAGHWHGAFALACGTGIGMYSVCAIAMPCHGIVGTCVVIGPRLVVDGTAGEPDSLESVKEVTNACAIRLEPERFRRHLDKANAGEPGACVRLTL